MIFFTTERLYIKVCFFFFGGGGGLGGGGGGRPTKVSFSPLITRGYILADETLVSFYILQQMISVYQL